MSKIRRGGGVGFSGWSANSIDSFDDDDFERYLTLISDEMDKSDLLYADAIKPKKKSDFHKPEHSAISDNLV